MHASRSTNSDAKEPTTETFECFGGCGGFEVPIQMPKSQPLKLSGKHLNFNASQVPIQMPKSQPLKRQRRAAVPGVFSVPIQMPKSQPLKRMLSATLPTIFSVPIQMPKSQPLKLRWTVRLTLLSGTNSDAKEPTTETQDAGVLEPGDVVPIQMPKSQPLKRPAPRPCAPSCSYQFRCQRANH